MQIKKGIAVSPGVAIHPAVVVDSEEQPVPRRTVPTGGVAHEQERLNQALEASTHEVQTLREQTATTLGEELAGIFSSHIGMLADAHVVGQMEQMIDSEHVTAEYAVYIVLRRLGQTFLHSGNTLLAERVSDVWDLERRMLKHLIGVSRSGLDQLDRLSVLVAHDLTPSQTASLDKQRIQGLLTDAGGRTSHTAILAHALGIPAIVGLEDLSRQISTGQTIIIDGNAGQVIVDPDAAQLMEYRQKVERLSALEDTLGEVRELPPLTTDGARVKLLGNIEFPNEIDGMIRNGGEGIGLYRTEFLFLANQTEPTEEEQLEAYTDALHRLEGQPLTLRTLDLGADKLLTSGPPDSMASQERNPFLGCRSIRLCLQNLPLFKTQLRAILRASTEGPVRIMFPLISNVMELRQARMILNDVMEDLDEQGLPYAANIPVGIMMEVPSAALQARALAREADFFSIGTNDLIQYTVAVDRGNERIASLYSAAHPAVIQLVKQTIRAANRAKIEVSLCGEMAGEPEYTMLLLGLGLRVFSITPPAIPEIKQIIRSVEIEQCHRLARKVSSFESEREVHNYLRDELSKAVPGVFDGRSIGD